MVEFIVIARPGSATPTTLDIGALDISATEIRAQRSAAVPAAVAAFIKENNLYVS